MPTKPLSRRIQQEAYQIVILQLAGVMIIAILAVVFAGVLNGFSALAGGFAYGLANLCFVWRVFRYAGAKQMDQFMMAFFLGEAMKLAMSAILFLLIVKYLPVSLLSTLVGFIGAIVSFWIACMWYLSRQAKELNR